MLKSCVTIVLWPYIAMHWGKFIIGSSYMQKYSFLDSTNINIMENYTYHIANFGITIYLIKIHLKIAKKIVCMYVKTIKSW